MWSYALPEARGRRRGPLRVSLLSFFLSFRGSSGRGVGQGFRVSTFERVQDICTECRVIVCARTLDADNVDVSRQPSGLTRAFPHPPPPLPAAVGIQTLDHVAPTQTFQVCTNMGCQIRRTEQSSMVVQPTGKALFCLCLHKVWADSDLKRSLQVPTPNPFSRCQSHQPTRQSPVCDFSSQHCEEQNLYWDTLLKPTLLQPSL